METYGSGEYPLDVFALAGRMGIILRPYSSVPLAKRSAFKSVSKDAFTIAPGEYEVDTTFICYDQDANKGRLRQSIAHEIAHIWLEHPSISHRGHQAFGPVGACDNFQIECSSKLAYPVRQGSDEEGRRRLGALLHPRFPVLAAPERPMALSADSCEV